MSRFKLALGILPFPLLATLVIIGAPTAAAEKPITFGNVETAGTVGTKGTIITTWQTYGLPTRVPGP